MIYKSNILFQIFKSFSLRTLLVMLFVIQIFFAVGTIGYLSYRNGQKAVNDLATQLQNEVAERIHQHLENYLEIPHLINKNHLNEIRLGLLDLRDPVMLGRHFWYQLQVFSSVSTVYFGNPKGGIILAGRQVDGSFAIEQTENFAAGNYQIYAVDDDGNRKKLLKTAPPFDSRDRPWYQVALKEGSATWSKVFFIYARQNLGIAASLPVYGEQGELLGVLTTQLVVSQIEDFLKDLKKNLKIGHSGQTFIMEPTGLLVASSTNEKPFVTVGEKEEQKQHAERLNALDSNEPLIRSTAHHLLEHFGSFSNISHRQQSIFKLDGQRQYLQIIPLRDNWGLDWLIVVAIPEADFMERINANTQATIWLSLGALAIALLMGLFTSKWIIQPILSLTSASVKLSKGQWDETLPVERSDELGVLAASFNSMVQQLRESFAVLATKNREIHKLNEDLEARVAKRTAELHAKVEELVQTRNELLQSEKMASLGRLVAGFAHEINTPIGVAVGAASTLLEVSQTVMRLMEQEEVDEDELISALESVEEAAELTLSNLRRAIRLVSSFKRTAVDQSSEVSRLYNVKETIEDVNNSLHNKFKKTEIKIHIDCPDSLILYGIPGVLDQVLTNLMMNSLFHGFENGTLSGEILITAQLQNDYLHLKYTDTGKGMSQETAEKIFEPFFTTRRGYGGSGLGMYICYNLVTSQLHGTISCVSSPGNGVTFFIDYPVQTSQPPISEY